ncbi:MULTISPECIES: GNAT family N-acetyltransferase [unclassified Streptomyces]|uniref:GNAT family N-acetyltransferase n=1 Tax=unclassified Streptomyces TaxID=2593676 RepID=UPI002E78B2CA|nr:GNAT family N-acetyltransferase [Streptomyces sp. JV176]MEE1797459.1 GNAT family N-acetyltransferase [Streptomyces sp. JV176]
MTTTLRPTGPLQQADDGTKSRSYEVCVNGRPAGAVEIATDPGFAHRAGIVRSLRIDGPDRRRGRATVAVLAAEEVLRGWGCDQSQALVPADAEAALHLAETLGYTERSRNMDKELLPGPAALPEGVEGRPMTEAEYEAWRARSVGDFARSWTDRGVPPDQALAKSEASHRENLPQGLATPGVSFTVLAHEGAAVGHVWVAPREVRPGRPGSYVYDVEVAEEQRGKGYGRALMLLAERVALEAGPPLLGLHVFTTNTPALRLYTSLGYRTTQRNLVRPLL